MLRVADYMCCWGRRSVVIGWNIWWRKRNMSFRIDDICLGGRVVRDILLWCLGWIGRRWNDWS